MVYEHYDSEIKKLNLRVEELTKEIDSLRKEIHSITVAIVTGKPFDYSPCG